MPSPRFIWKLQAVVSGDKAHVFGVVSRKNPGVITPDDSAWNTLAKIVRSYFSKPARGISILAKYPGGQEKVAVDKYGAFECALPTGAVDAMSFSDAETGQTLPVLQHYPMIFPGSEAAILLISDIDDTILISKSSKLISRLRLLLLKPSISREPVEPTYKAFCRLKEGGEVHFAYVSNSEANLFHLLASFFKIHNLPEAPMLLRPWTHWKDLVMGRATPLSKFYRIQKLMEWYPEKRVVLFGDDSQEDLNVFQQTATAYPDRIHSLFLRKTGLTKRFATLEFESKMHDTDHTLYYYDNFESLNKPIQSIIDEATGRS